MPEASLDRESVTGTFASIGEPLTIRLDMASADPSSPVDVIFVPGSRRSLEERDLVDLAIRA